MSTDTRITTSCPVCGEVELLAEQMWVVLAEPAERSHYGFRCPSCGTESRHGADLETLTLLASLVPVELMEVPAEALEPRSGRPLTDDDLIDLMVGLEGGVEALLGCQPLCETC
jgi:predicted RNA-binding Zn-ribbon protein involved in translation (DUF1610 family)